MDRRAQLVALLLVGSAAAQSTPPAPTTPPKEPDPALKDASLGDVAGSRQSRPATPPDIQPTKPPAPAPVTPTPPPAAKPTLGPIGGLPSEAGLPGRRFYPEGTFLSRRKGRLFRSTTGDVIFLPERDSKKRGEAPMVVMGCQELDRLEAVPDAFATDVNIVLSGQVYVYYDRQYILPSAYSVERIAPAANPSGTPAATSDPADTKPATTAAKTAADDPDVAALIRDLETKRGTARAIDPTPTADTKPNANGSKPDGKPKTADKAAIRSEDAVTPEGTMLLNRRARLVRLTGGLLAAAFDGDTQSPGPAPMPLLRCRMTQKLDEAARSRGEDLTITVSGRVTVYGGRNYLLPTLIQVATTGDIKPQQ